mgnify:CR=1 FL=1
MTITKEQNGKTLTVSIEGRVDTTTAPALEKALLPSDSAAFSGIEALVIDAENLVYISSAGLRVLMKTRKVLEKPVSVINVSRDVYDIFETTGFTSILTVQKKLRTVSVEGCEVIGEGANGKVYRLDDETIIKVFAPGVPLSVVQEERDFAQAAFVAGVPTAISFDVVRAGESYGAVYEMLNAKTLSAVITEHPERAEELGRRMGTLLRALHSTQADTTKLHDMLAVYKERVAALGKYVTKEELEKIKRVYDALESRGTILHGDFHPKNIMYQNDELIFIDMGDVGYGHPLLDLGGSYLAMVRIGKHNPQRTPVFIGLDYPLLLTVWNAMLKAYFGKDDVSEEEKLLAVYGEAKYALTPVFYTKATEELIGRMVESTRTAGILQKDFDISPALQLSIQL